MRYYIASIKYKPKSHLMKKLMAVFFALIHFASIAAPTVFVKEETLKAGSTVRVTINSVNTSQLQVGSTITGMCQSGVTIKGNEFISAGAPVQMRVVSYEKRKMAGKPAKVTLQAISVTAVDGTQVQLRGGDLSAEGKNRMAIAIAPVLFGVLLTLLIKGGEAEIAPGTTVDAFVANDAEIEVD